MALQASGPISFLQISGEFGLPSNKNIGAYRVSQTVGELSNLPLDNNIPQAGAIRFSDFYSKKLNVVMNFVNGSRINARTSYDNNSTDIISVIGGFRIRPVSSSQTKVFIHVSGTIQPFPLNDILHCSLLTGNWDNGTDLTLDIGPNGVVMGDGGDGGFGGSPGNDGGNGSNGGSAIGVTYQPISIINRGIVVSGTGGGGGGGGGSRESISASGGSGGGGRPFGVPGAGLLTQGQGFAGGSASNLGTEGFLNQIFGGDGGSGGTPGGSASSAGNPDRPSESLGSGGSPGQSGFAFVISTDGSAVTIDLGANTLGSVTYNTSPS